MPANTIRSSKVISLTLAITIMGGCAAASAAEPKEPERAGEWARIIEQEADAFRTTADRKSAQDTAVVRAVFDDGTVAESHFAFATVDEDRFELYFEGSKACFDRFRKTHIQSRSATFRYGRAAALGEGLAAIGGSLSRVIRQPGEPAFAASLAAFIAAVRGRGGPLADFEDGFTSLALVDAARRSAACGQSVRVEYPIK